MMYFVLNRINFLLLVFLIGCATYSPWPTVYVGLKWEPKDEIEVVNNTTNNSTTNNNTEIKNITINKNDKDKDKDKQ